MDFERERFEISYGISPSYWGRGFFKEILGGLMDICLKKDRFTRCQAITFKDNKRSIRGLISNGFKSEGVLKKYYFDFDNKKHFDGIILAKTI